MHGFCLLKGEKFDVSNIAQIDSQHEKFFKLSFRAINDPEIASKISHDIGLNSK